MPSSDNGHRAAAARHARFHLPRSSRLRRLSRPRSAGRPAPPAAPIHLRAVEEGSVRRPLIRATCRAPKGSRRRRVRCPSSRFGSRPTIAVDIAPAAAGTAVVMHKARDRRARCVSGAAARPGSRSGAGQGQRQQQGGRPHRPSGGRPGPRRGGKKPVTSSSSKFKVKFKCAKVKTGARVMLTFLNFELVTLNL